MKITYLTEPVDEYQKGLTEAKNTEELLAHIRKFKTIALDAYISVGQVYFNFAEFKEGLAKERKKEYAGDAWADKYNQILMPMVMFQATTVSIEFSVPWGLAYMRLKEGGHIKEVRGIAYWIGDKK